MERGMAPPTDHPARNPLDKWHQYARCHTEFEERLRQPIAAPYRPLLIVENESGSPLDHHWWLPMCVDQDLDQVPDRPWFLCSFTDIIRGAVRSQKAWEDRQARWTRIKQECYQWKRAQNVRTRTINSHRHWRNQRTHQHHAPGARRMWTPGNQKVANPSAGNGGPELCASQQAL